MSVDIQRYKTQADIQMSTKGQREKKRGKDVLFIGGRGLNCVIFLCCTFELLLLLVTKRSKTPQKSRRAGGGGRPGEDSERRRNKRIKLIFVLWAPTDFLAIISHFPHVFELPLPRNYQKRDKKRDKGGGGRGGGGGGEVSKYFFGNAAANRKCTNAHVPSFVCFLRVTSPFLVLDIGTISCILDTGNLSLHSIPFERSNVVRKKCVQTFYRPINIFREQSTGAATDCSSARSCVKTHHFFRERCCDCVLIIAARRSNTTH
jgi:hypothetical protein